MVAPTGPPPRRDRQTLIAAGLAVATTVAVTVGGVALAGRHAVLAGHGTVALPSPRPTIAATAKPTTGRAAPAPAGSALVDPCLVGTWRETSYDITNHIDGNPVLFTGPGGAVETYRADGVSTVNFDPSAPMTATVAGNAWAETVRGQVSAHFQTRNGMYIGSNVVAHGAWTLTENGAPNNGGPLSIDLLPLTYTCSGNSARFIGSASAIELTRISHSPGSGGRTQQDRLRP